MSRRARRSYLSTAFILEEGTALADARPGRRGAGRGGAGPPGCGWSPATPRSSTPGTATASTSTPPASGSSPPASTSARGRARPGDVVIVSGDIGVHGVAVHELPRGPGVRHRGRERHRAAARAGRRDARHRARTCTCCATRPAAASRRRSTRSPRPPASGSSSWSATSRSRPSRRRRLRDARAGPAVRRQRGQAGGLRPARRRADAVLAAMRAHPLGGGAAVIGRSWRSTRRWWWPAPGSGRRGWWTCRSASSCPGSADPDGARPGQPPAPVVTAARVATVVAQAFMRQEL